MKQFTFLDKKWVLENLKNKSKRKVALMFYEIHKKRFEIKNHKTFGITIRRIEKLFLEWTKKKR